LDLALPGMRKRQAKGWMVGEVAEEAPARPPLPGLPEGSVMISPATKVATRALRRANGLCYECAAKIPPGDTRVRCERCRSRRKELISTRDVSHFPRCSRRWCEEIVDTSRGGALGLCPVHYRQQLKAEGPRTRQAIRDERHAAGLCIVCETPMGDNPRMRCPPCQEKNSPKRISSTESAGKPVKHRQDFGYPDRPVTDLQRCPCGLLLPCACAGMSMLVEYATARRAE
jgi:hypothetical protein